MISFIMWRNIVPRRYFYIKLKKSCFFMARFSRWLKRSQKHVPKHNDLLRTEMLVQEGFDIYELPIVIKKINDIEGIFSSKEISNFPIAISKTEPLKKYEFEEQFNALNLLHTEKINSKFGNISNLLDPNISNKQVLNEEQILNGFANLKFQKRIQSLLETAVNTEINSKIALQCLKRIISMERKYRNYMRASKFIPNRHTMLRNISEIIIKSQDSEVILEALSIILKDTFYPPNNSYRDILTNEALIRSTNGDFSIQQLIDITRVLTTFRDPKCLDTIDYFWTGLVIKQEDITVQHLVPLFKLLIYMKKSRNRVQILLEKKLIKNYHKLFAPQITDLINTCNNNLKSPIVLKCASKWSTLHLPTISKYNLLEFIESLTAAEYVNFTLEKAIEKSIGAKQMKSNDHALMAAIAVYCSTVYLKNIYLCNRIVKYLAKHGKHLPLDPLVEMVIALGNLNYDLQSKDDFWQIFEEIFNQQFFYFEQEKVMQIMLSCAYINKYFPKCMEKIFSQEFLGKLELRGNSSSAQTIRDQLYLLDTAMTIECTKYKGPLLFRSNLTNAEVIDMRIMRIINRIHSQLVRLAGDSQKLSRHVMLSNLSAVPLYTIDALIHKQPKSTSAVELDLSKEKNKNTAILVLLPHHYCWNSYKLRGQEAMKIRLLRKLGLRVMLLDFNNLCSIQNKVDESTKYINRAFKIAHEAL